MLNHSNMCRIFRHTASLGTSKFDCTGPSTILIRGPFSPIWNDPVSIKALGSTLKKVIITGIPTLEKPGAASFDKENLAGPEADK